MTNGATDTPRQLRIRARQLRKLVEDGACDVLSAAKELASSARIGEAATHVARTFFAAAVNLMRRDKWSEALDLLGVATELSPDDPRIAYRSALALDVLGRRAEAFDMLTALLEKNPTYSQAAAFIGFHAEAERIETIGERVAPLALEHLRGHPATFADVLVVLVRLMRFEEASALVDQVDSLDDPKVAAGAFEIGINTGDVALAQRALRERAWSRDARQEKEVWRLRLALLKANRTALIAPWERLVESGNLHVVDPQTRHAAAMALGRYSEGFASNWSWPLRQRVGKHIPQLYQAGESLTALSDANVLIIAYTELGDEIRLIELVDRVRVLFGSCTIVVDRRIAELVARGRPDLTVVGKEKVAPDFDQTVPPPLRRHLGAAEWGRISSFDRVFLIRDFESLLIRTVDDLPHLARSLQPRDDLRSMWREKLDRFGTRPWIGLFWRSGRLNYRRSAKTSNLADWIPIFDACRGNYVNLQFGAGVSQEIAALAAKAKIVEMPGLDVKNDIDSIAALMCELDLVLTIPGTTMLLAGAMGARTIAVTESSQALFRARPGTDIGTWSPNVEVVTGPPSRGVGGAIANTARRLRQILLEPPDRAVR